MAKYSYEINLQIVYQYINDEGSYKYIAKRHIIPSY